MSRWWRGVVVTAGLGLALTGCASGGAPGASRSAVVAGGSSGPDAASGPVRVPLPPAGGSQVWRIAVAPDGASALVARSAGFFPRTRQSSIHALTRGPDGAWQDAGEAPFAGEGSSDIDPFWSADGSRVCSSIRPVDGVARTDVDVWYVDRGADGAWGEPVNAGAVNSPADDLFPSVAPDGSLYVGSDRGGLGFDIWRAPAAGGGWALPEPLPAPVSLRTWEFNPVVAPDGSALVFTARGRDGGEGEGDLFFSRPGPAGWGEPSPLADLNSAGDEYHPAFSPDGGTLYFVRGGTLYQTPVSATALAG